MAQSHGMSDAQWARQVFDYEYARRSSQEKKQFLIDTIVGFTTQVNYKTKGDIITEFEVAQAAHALELFVAPYLDDRFSNVPRPVDLTHMDRVISALRSEISRLQILIDIQPVVDGVEQCVSRTQRALAELGHEQNRRDVTTPSEQRVSGSQVNGRSIPEIGRSLRIVYSSKKYQLDVYPSRPSNDPYTSGLMEIVENVVRKNRTLANIGLLEAYMDNFSVTHTREQIEHDFSRLLGTVLDDVTTILRRPQNFAANNYGKNFLKAQCLYYAGNAARYMRQSKVDLNALFLFAPQFRDFLGSSSFDEFGVYLCRGYFRNPDAPKPKRQKLRDLMEVTFDLNPGIAVLAASTYLVFTHDEHKDEPFPDCARRVFEKYGSDNVKGRILSRDVGRGMRWDDIVDRGALIASELNINHGRIPGN